MNVKNLTSQIKILFLGSDPYRFQTNLADSAYIDLVNLTLSTNGSLTGYSHAYIALATRAGKIYDKPTCDAYFTKIPPPVLGQKLL